MAEKDCTKIYMGVEQQWEQEHVTNGCRAQISPVLTNFVHPKKQEKLLIGLQGQGSGLCVQAYELLTVCYRPRGLLACYCLIPGRPNPHSPRGSRDSRPPMGPVSCHVMAFVHARTHIYIYIYTHPHKHMHFDGTYIHAL